jgi:hypothetical protein
MSITQQFTQKYAIIQLFEDAPEGTMFSSNSWPLHSTIVDVFAISWDVTTMIEKLVHLLSNHQQATSCATDDAYFGPDKQTHVMLLEKTDSLVQLHTGVIGLLDDGVLVLNDPQFAREGFLPHATVLKHARLNKGDPIVFSALSIVDFFPNGDPYMRKILKTIRIGGE